MQVNLDLTQRELVNKLGMSVGGLNYFLNALIVKGFVKMANFSKIKNKFNGNRPLKPGALEVEFFPMEEVLNEKVQIHR